MNFAILASPRTGSSHLTSLLNKQPDILCHGGIFLSRNVYLRWPKTELTPELKAELSDLRSADPTAYLERVFAVDHGCAHIGFKMFDGHNDDMLGHVLDDTSIKKIVLFRRNALANYASGLQGRESGDYGAKAKGGVKYKPPTVHFHERKFLRFYGTYTNYYRGIARKLSASGQHFHLLHYEDINDGLLFQNMLRFIGASTENVALESKRSKQNSPDILSRFDNPEEVRQFLEDNGLLGWCHEGSTLLDVDDLTARPIEVPKPEHDEDMDFAIGAF